MAGYSIVFDEARGILLSRVDRDFPDAGFEAYRDALKQAVREARRLGPLLMLSDNRDNKIFGQVRAELLWEILCENGDPRDRIALLLANSLAKLKTRDQAGSRAQTFASENAAYTWLSAGQSIAA